MPILFAKREVEVVEKLLEATGKVTVSDLVAQAKVNESYVRRTMHNLVDEGLVVRTSKSIGAGTCYEVNEGDARAKLEQRVKDTQDDLAKKNKKKK